MQRSRDRSRFGQVGGGYSSEALAIFAAMSPEPSLPRKLVINSTVAALKAADLWDDFDILYMIAAHAAQPARINWKNPGTFTASVVSSPVFTADQGYNGNLAGYLNTGFTPSVNGVQMTTNAAHVSAWTLSTAIGRDFDFLVSTRNATVTAFTEFAFIQAGNTVVGRINGGSSASVAAPTPLDGFYIADRSDSATAALYYNGTSLDAITGTPVELIDRPLLALARGIAAPDFFSSLNIAILSAGANLGSTKRAAAQSVFSNYLAAVGAI